MAYKFDPNVRYAKTHDWVRIDAERGLAVCGISDFAQHALSDVVYVELPDVGTQVSQGDVYTTVESVKAAEEVFAPVSGEIVAVNEALEDEPEALNSDPYGAWIIKVQPADLSQLDALMDAAAYEAFVAAEEAGGH
ncbi:MAG TPA: glycine cleavage system protein GcvH [Anaerolineae bacterium]|nr:glycine cleavage system protein GcvH [Anaerolineae bacterium]